MTNSLFIDGELNISVDGAPALTLQLHDRTGHVTRAGEAQNGADVAERETLGIYGSGQSSSSKKSPIDRNARCKRSKRDRSDDDASGEASDTDEDANSADDRDCHDAHDRSVKMEPYNGDLVTVKPEPLDTLYDTASDGSCFDGSSHVDSSTQKESAVSKDPNASESQQVRAVVRYVICKQS